VEMALWWAQHFALDLEASSLLAFLGSVETFQRKRRTFYTKACPKAKSISFATRLTRSKQELVMDASLARVYLVHWKAKRRDWLMPVDRRAKYPFCAIDVT